MKGEKKPGWVTALLREHPALLVSVVYVAASTIGMAYSWAFLRHFGINIFNYAQIGDFLLASLKEPSTWLLVFPTLRIPGELLLQSLTSVTSRPSVSP